MEVTVETRNALVDVMLKVVEDLDVEELVAMTVAAVDAEIVKVRAERDAINRELQVERETSASRSESYETRDRHYAKVERLLELRRLSDNLNAHLRDHRTPDTLADHYR